MTEPVTSRNRAQHEEPGGSGRGLVLAVVLVGFFMILLDGTIVNIAIPPLQQDLGASYSAIQWVVSGYALAYGLLLIPAGRLGDRFGHRRLFLVGLAGFTLSSLLCGTATTGAQLVAWRVVQGMTAGVMNPAILAVIQAVYRPAERPKAFAWYGATAGLATALGPLLGGLFVAWDLQGLGWRPIFLLNLPIGLATLAVAFRVVPDHRGRGGSVDPVGIVLVTAALLLLIYPLINGREAGWPPSVFLSLGAVVPVTGAFVAWQVHRVRSGAAPLVDVRLFGNRAFAAGVGMTLSYFAGFISLQFVLSVYLQLGLGRSALATGLALVPFAAGTFAGSAISDRLARRLGRRVLHAGCGLVIAGFAGVIVMIHLLGVAITGWWLVPPLLVSGIGSGVVIATTLGVVLADVPEHEAGAAGGVLNTAQRVGQSLGVAIAGTALFGAAGSPAADVAPGALAQEFTYGVQIAAGCSLAAIVVTYLLVFLLPGGSRRP